MLPSPKKAKGEEEGVSVDLALLELLPNETLWHILVALPAADVLAVASASRRLREVAAGEELWRFLVRVDFLTPRTVEDMEEFPAATYDRQQELYRASFPRYKDWDPWSSRSTRTAMQLYGDLLLQLLFDRHLLDYFSVLTVELVFPVSASVSVPLIDSARDLLDLIGDVSFQKIRNAVSRGIFEEASGGLGFKSGFDKLLFGEFDRWMASPRTIRRFVDTDEFVFFRPEPPDPILPYSMRSWFLAGNKFAPAAQAFVINDVPEGEIVFDFDGVRDADPEPTPRTHTSADGRIHASWKESTYEGSWTISHFLVEVEVGDISRWYRAFGSLVRWPRKALEMLSPSKALEMLSPS